MIRKFKHNKLHWIARESENSPKYYECHSMINYIPKELIEQSNDWEELIEKEVLFTTEDGIEITKDYNETLYSCLKDIINTGEQLLVYSTTQAETYLNSDREGKSFRLFFSDKNKCKEYMDKNTPKYSKKQIDDVFKILNKAIFADYENSIYSEKLHIFFKLDDIKQELGIC